MLSSCSAVNRALHAEVGESNIPASVFIEKYHPKGILEEVVYRCSVNGPSTRRMMVYLPDDYYSSDKSYPVLYLLHGARGNETSWLTEGGLIPIMDSLSAAGLVQPCIIVLPNMNQYDTDLQGELSSFKNPILSFFETDGAVEYSFRTDVVNFIDGKYRTMPDKAHRAIAGLSIGSLQSVFISARNPELFDYIGLFSPIYKSPIKRSEYSSYYKKLRSLQKIQFADPPKLYYLMVGDFDFFFNHTEYYRRYLNAKGYPFQYYSTKGGHEWSNWREYLTIFRQKCFR